MQGVANQDVSGGGKPSRILSVLLMGVFMGALDIAIVGPALNPIGVDFGVDERSLAWVFTIYVLFNLIGNPILGKLSDLNGRRGVYMTTIAMFALGSLVVVVSPQFQWMLIGRAIQGFAAGGIFPVASATIGETFPPERRGRALGATGAMFGVAFLIGPFLGGLLLRFGWHSLFIINLPLSAVLLVWSARVFPPSIRRQGARFDWAGMTLLVVGLVLLALGLNRIDTRQFLHSLFSMSVWPFFAVAVLLLLLFYRVEQRVEHPVIRPDLLRNHQLLMVNLLSIVNGVVQAGLIFVPLLAAVAFGLNPSAASFVLGPAVLASAVGSPVTGRLLDRYGSRTVIKVGTSVLALGLATVPFVLHSLTLFIASGVLIGLGLASLTGAPLRYVALNEAGGESRAAAQSLLAICSSIGQMTGAVVIGAIVASHLGTVQGYALSFALVAGVALTGVLFTFGLKDREAERRTAVQSANR